MSANENDQLAGAGELPPIPADVLRGAEERLRKSQGRRRETRRKIENMEFQNIDTARRLRARVERVLGDPLASRGAAKTAGGALESLGVDDELPDVLLERII